MASGQEHGLARVQFADQSETKMSAAIDYHTSVHSGGALAAPTGAALDAIPRIGMIPVAGQRLVLSFITDAADIVESEESDCEIPVLILDKISRKVKGRKTIKLEAMTGFKPSGTVDTPTLTVGVPHRIAYFDANDGDLLMLDPSGKLRAYFGDDA